MKSTSEILRVGSAFAWIEDQKAINLKASAPDGGPLVLDVEQARKLSEVLARLATNLENIEAERVR